MNSRGTSTGTAGVTVIHHLACLGADNDEAFGDGASRPASHGDVQVGPSSNSTFAQPGSLGPTFPFFDFLDGYCHSLVRPKLDAEGFASIS